MPIINGEEVLNVTAAQLEELVFNIGFGSVDYPALQPTPYKLFSDQSVAASSSVKNTIGVATGNNAKMSVTFYVTGGSTNCTMYLYGSDHEDLSLPGILAISNLSTGMEPNRRGIYPIDIPAYTFAEIINLDPVNPAIGTIEINVWK